MEESTMQLFRTGLLIFGFFLFSMPAFAADPSISVSAKGTASAMPDMAEFQVRLQATAPRAADALERTASTYQRLRSALLEEGIAERDAVSSSISVAQEWEWNNATKKREFKGYTANHLLHVTVRKLADAGRIIDAAARAGADEISGIRFTSSRYEELYRQALADAVGNAREKADVMAEAAGVSRGRLLDMQSGAMPVMPVRDNVAYEAVRSLASSPPTEVVPGELDVTAHVSCRWSIDGR